MVRTMVTTVLSGQGYHVLAAANGDEALRMVINECSDIKIHLLLTDMVMPQMGGLELATKLRELYPDTKVIFTSGYTEEPMFQQGSLEPGTEFIKKPYVPALLGQKVRMILDQPVI